MIQPNWKFFTNRFYSLALATVAVVGLASCGEDDDTTPPPAEPVTLAELLAETAELSTLNSILTSTDYDFSAVLTIATDPEAGPVTVFAPTDAAFTSFLNERELTLADIPAADVEALVSNHILTGSFVNEGNDLTGPQTTLEGSPMYINNASGVVINGAVNVTTADIIADNGVVHIVDAVITIPENIVDTAVGAGFSSLAAALTQVSNDQAQTDLITALSGTTEYTVFAPTNAAFATFLDGAELSSIPNDLLETVLTYHVVTGTVYSGDLSAGAVTSFEGTDFTVNIDGTVTISDQAGNTVTVTTTDIQCSNGVIHIIDGVIDPRTP